MKTVLVCATLVLSSFSTTPLLAQAVAPASTPPVAPGAAAAPSAAALKVDNDTPIEAIAATPAGKAALEKYIPELLPHPAYEQFKGMSLRQLEPLSGGIITDEKIAAVEAALKAPQ